MKAKIESFNGYYRFLSNFWPAQVSFEGETYPSVEHAYQAAKTINATERVGFTNPGLYAGKAKAKGRRVTLRPDWDKVKVAIMKELLEKKFSPGSPLARLLIDTGTAELIEGNTWGDRFWGVCGGVGENWLGRLLMEVREKL